MRARNFIGPQSAVTSRVANFKLIIFPLYQTNLGTTCNNSNILRRVSIIIVDICSDLSDLNNQTVDIIPYFSQRIVLISKDSKY